MVIVWKAFDLHSNGRFLLRHGGCVVIALTTCIGNLKIRKSAFCKEIYGDFLGFPWWQKLKQKLSTAIAARRTVKISWSLIGFWEKLKKIAQTGDHFMLHLEFMKHIIYWLLSKTPIQTYYRDMKVNNLSTSPSLALFFI